MNISFVHAPGEPATYAGYGVAAWRSRFPIRALHARASRASILPVSLSVQGSSPSIPQSTTLTKITFNFRLAPNSSYRLADSTRRIPILFFPRVAAGHAATTAQALTHAVIMRVLRQLSHTLNLWSASGLPGCRRLVEVQTRLSREPSRLRALKGIHRHVVHRRAGRAPRVELGGVA
jgi:hypothetical protein